MFFKDFVSVKRQKIKRGASQTYDTPSFCHVEEFTYLRVVKQTREFNDRYGKQIRISRGWR